MNQGFSNNAASSQRFTQRMMPAVFGWMFAGLLMTAIIAGVLLQNNEAITMLKTPLIFYSVVAAQIITVIFFSKGG